MSRAPISVEAQDGCTLAQLEVQKDALRRALARLEAINANCCSCKQFDLGSCRMHGDIPKEFQKVVGECPDWAYDGIPF